MKNDYLRFTTSMREAVDGFCELFKQKMKPIDCVHYERRTKLTFERTLEWTFLYVIALIISIGESSTLRITHFKVNRK